MKTRVLLADDHQMFRHALRTMLEQESSIQVVGEAGDGQELLKIAGGTPVDVVCMDIGMPRMNGIEATRRLLGINPAIKVIGVSAFADRDYVLDMLKAGASGYVTKSETGDELLRAIRAVRLNRTYLCPEIAATVAGALIDGSDGKSAAPRIGARERQVLQLVAEGNTSAEIAQRLHVAFSTVEVHRRNIMRKLDLHNVAELTKYAIRNGITTSATNGG
ncbi:MAG: response regulator transcription factor [Sulfuritalea sp.]|jgi:two-component system NarL family response regulator|nr:response regulator transcription factor [Sulfuritalea sp.]